MSVQNCTLDTEITCEVEREYMRLLIIHAILAFDALKRLDCFANIYLTNKYLNNTYER